MQHCRRALFFRLAILMALLLLLAGPAPAGARAAEPNEPLAGAPQVVSYQGQLNIDGAPYNSTGYFKFAIVNQAGDTSYWSNDNTSADGNMPAAAVQLAVTKGAFSVLLGDTSVPNMQALPASAFSTPDRYLRVWFSSTAGGAFTQLSPDSRIAAVPYALQAEAANTAATATNADTVDEMHASAFATSSHTHPTLTAGAGLNGGTYDGGAAKTFSVIYGASANMAVQGNQTVTIAAGNGLTGGTSSDGMGNGVSATLTVVGGNGIAAKSDNLELAPLTADWDQTGASDVVLDNVASELKILGSSGGHYGILDAGDLSGLSEDQTYTFGLGGTVWTSGNDGPASGLDADTVDGVHGSALQQRVTGTCAVGNTVRSVNADGTVTCEPHDTSPVFSLTTLDSAENSGYYTSATTGADGLPLISYMSSHNGASGTEYNLKVAHCSDVACTSAAIATVDSGTSAGWGSSVAIGADGLPVISYYDGASASGLKVAHCSNALCTSATLTMVDSAAGAGTQTSIAIGTDGWPLIAYSQDNNEDLNAVHCTNADCTSHDAPVTLDSSGNVGQYASLAIGADGFPLISYYDVTGGNLKVAHCTSANCSTQDTPTFVDNTTDDVGRGASVTIGADGLPVISYLKTISSTNHQLKVAHCSDVACSASTISTANGSGDADAFTSVTIGADGLPLIAHYDRTGYLAVAHCSNTACTASTLTVWSQMEGTGASYPSATIGVDGMALIAYQAPYGGYDLKVAHCSNALCMPYVRRR